jgi:hypothetical protein
MNKTYTTEELNLIRAEQLKQIKNPTRAIVNVESAFVYDRLGATHPTLGAKYWFTVTMRESFGASDVDTNQIKLTEIDRQSRMPSWGTYGT